jgi:hypothetical protein
VENQRLRGTGHIGKLTVFRVHVMGRRRAGPMSGRHAAVAPARLERWPSTRRCDRCRGHARPVSPMARRPSAIAIEEETGRRAARAECARHPPFAVASLAGGIGRAVAGSPRVAIKRGGQGEAQAPPRRASSPPAD